MLFGVEGWVLVKALFLKGLWLLFLSRSVFLAFQWNVLVEFFYCAGLVFDVITSKMAILKARISLSLEAVLSLCTRLSYSERKRTFRLNDGGKKSPPVLRPLLFPSFCAAPGCSFKHSCPRRAGRVGSSHPIPAEHLEGFWAGCTQGISKGLDRVWCAAFHRGELLIFILCRLLAKFLVGQRGRLGWRKASPDFDLCRWQGED